MKPLPRARECERSHLATSFVYPAWQRERGALRCCGSPEVAVFCIWRARQRSITISACSAIHEERDIRGEHCRFSGHARVALLSLGHQGVGGRHWRADGKKCVVFLGSLEQRGRRAKVAENGVIGSIRMNGFLKCRGRARRAPGASHRLHEGKRPKSYPGLVPN